MGVAGRSQVFSLIYGLAEHNGPIIVTAAITLTSALLVLAAETSPLRLDARASFPASDMLNVCCAPPSHDARFTVTDPTARAIRLQSADDVAITTGDVAAGTLLDVGGQQILLRGDVPRGHKLAVRDIGPGGPSAPVWPGDRLRAVVRHTQDHPAACAAIHDYGSRDQHRKAWN